MAAVIEKLKRDFAKHKVKAAVLGVLSVLMVVFTVKGVFEMSPSTAAASQVANLQAGIDQPEAASVRQETEDRLRQGEKLWRVLREKRGIEPAVAFTFDAAYFAPDPNRKIAPEPQTHADVQPDHVSVSPETTAEAERRAKITAIREQARTLIVKSTVVGGVKPIAVVNERIMVVGDRVQGFEIIAIRAREVEFKKDDVTLAVKMADDSRSQ